MTTSAIKTMNTNLLAGKQGARLRIGIRKVNNALENKFRFKLILLTND